MASDAAIPRQHDVAAGRTMTGPDLPMPLSLVLLLLLRLSLGVSTEVMVEVDDDRLKVLARGARWVSLSSALASTPAMI